MPNHFQQIIVIINPVGARFIAPDGRDTSKKQGAMNCAPTVGTVMPGYYCRGTACRALDVGAMT